MAAGDAEVWLEILLLLVEVFHSLSVQDLPEFFEVFFLFLSSFVVLTEDVARSFVSGRWGGGGRGITL